MNSVFGELSPEEGVRDEDLRHDVHEVEDLADEELNGPVPVLVGVLLPLLHVSGHLGHFLVQGGVVGLGLIQTHDDFLSKREKRESNMSSFIQPANTIKNMNIPSAAQS